DDGKVVGAGICLHRLHFRRPRRHELFEMFAHGVGNEFFNHDCSSPTKITFSAPADPFVPAAFSYRPTRRVSYPGCAANTPGGRYTTPGCRCSRGNGGAGGRCFPSYPADFVPRTPPERRCI